MGVPAMIQALMQGMCLDQAELQQRYHLLDWRSDDIARLQQLGPELEPLQSQFIESLYALLAEFPEPSALLQGEGTLERLKQSQLHYYRSLWQSADDHEYVASRVRIGLIHDIAGVELKWYLGGYRLYLQTLLNALLPQSPAREVFSSLLKRVFFDLSITIDTYSASQRQALEDSDARFARALRGANDGIWDWDVELDRLYVSDRWAQMLGFNVADIAPNSQGWFNLVHPDDAQGFTQTLNNHLKGLSEHVHFEYRIRTFDGSYLWVLARGVAETDASGRRRISGSQTDISQRKAAEATLRYAARHDPLTGLINRQRLKELTLSVQAQLLQKSARHAALLFIDLDRFKLINDSLGHAVGDQVLIQVSQRLSGCLREGDYLCRFGGDEFVALLSDLAAPADAEDIAQRMLDALHVPMYMQSQVLVVSASIGISVLSGQGDAQEALQAADLALYQAKQAGKAQFARYSAGLQSKARRQLALESALAQALGREEFVLHYQPIYRLCGDQRQMVGVEALLRWQHGAELVSPMEFIASLEESGEILPVGDWVLYQACQQVSAWQAQGQRALYCAVNLSIRQLKQPQFVERVQQVLAATGLSATSLVLELTESQLMQDSVLIMSVLRELAALGVRLALDDFGTGYSSLGYLNRFPLHILKVDKSFIGAVPANPELVTISRAIIGLGRSLGLEVIAEGVETGAHIAFLAEQSCQLAQGFGLARPMPAAGLAALLAAESSA